MSLALFVVLVLDFFNHLFTSQQMQKRSRQQTKQTAKKCAGSLPERSDKNASLENDVNIILERSTKDIENVLCATTADHNWASDGMLCCSCCSFHYY